MNNLQIFKNNDFGEIRTVLIEDKPYFVGKDIANALGYKNASVTLQDNVDDEDKGVTKVSTLGGLQDTTVINESGLYALVFGSKLKKAKEFKHWVTSEVLPSIRKTGGYVSNDDLFINTYLPFADEQTKLLFKTTLETVKSLNAQIEKDKPKVLFADAVAASKVSILVGELAKLLKQNGVHTGQNRLFGWLRENGYLIKRNGNDFNMPTQRSMEQGLFEIKETTIAHADGHTSISKTPKVTGKGQAYFINLFLGKSA